MKYTYESTVCTDSSKTAKEVARLMLAMGREDLGIAYMVTGVRCVKETALVPTAAVDDKGNLLVCATFWQGLAGPNRKGLILHELLHLALEHHKRREQREPRLFNDSTDGVINTIVKDGYRLPPIIPGWVLPPAEYKGALVSEELYAWYKANPDQQPRGTGEAGKGCGVLEGELTEGESGEAGEPREPSQVNAEGLKAIYRGQGGNVAKVFERLDSTPATCPRWKTIMRRALSALAATTEGSDHATYSRVKRKFGLIHPTYKGSTPSIAVLIDVSGSMSPEVRDSVVKQTVKLANEFSNLKILIISHTDQVQYVGRARAGSMKAIAEQACAYSGGTEFRPAYERAAKELPGCSYVIHFTDMQGESKWPDVPPRAKLIICDYSQGDSSWGTKPPASSVVVKMDI